MKYKFIYISLLALLLFSCDDYLDVEPKGKVIPTTITDFDELLIGGYSSIYATSDPQAMWLSSDDTDKTNRLRDFGDLSSPTNKMVKYFRWDKDRYPIDANVELWELPYLNLYTLNKVVNEVDGAKGNDDDAKARIKAEARVMRAYEYYILVNSFGKQYDATSASSDLGVPLVLSADIEAKTPARSSVQEIYDFIISELKESVTDLPEVEVGPTRPAKETGYGILARVYLQMGDYENAKINANSALELNNSLGDYTSGSLGSVVLAERYMSRYYKYAVSSYYPVGMSADAKTIFDTINDKRANGIWAWSNFRKARQLSYSAANSHCVSVPEMYVIRAECNARLTDASVADVLEDLNTLRRNRIIGYVDSTGVATKEAVLAFALEERRRELMPTGFRLFDLKRLNKEPAFAKTITHELEGEVFTLEPNSDRYVFPIPDKVLKFNPNMEPNP